uniref:CAMPATH-1 antigen n=1 Tax=Jaculus jaculus TaxID=51337 RepID=UPI001E1B3D0B|nr:CAMPATH-1 antigen [Jaculus jaculus]
MNSSLFFLLNMGLLVTAQLYTGALGNQTTAFFTNPSPRTTTTTTTTSVDITTTTTMSTKMNKNGAPALSNMSGGTFLFFLANTLIHLFYFS